MFENGRTFGEMGINSYPLSWPSGWKREKVRGRSRFQIGFARARDQLFHELRLMGVGDWDVILSTNVPLRRDGLPYAGMAQPQDPGVSVYFRYKDKPRVFACDTYQKVEENLYAITKTIEALRGIQRWGASDMLERSFSGFEALPPPQSTMQKREWWIILGCNHNATAAEIKDAYRKKAYENHPDHGGSQAAMTEVNRAYEEAQK